MLTEIKKQQKMRVGLIRMINRSLMIVNQHKNCDNAIEAC